MIVLDTNVISEPLWRSPEANVIERIDALALQTLFLSVIDAELPAGVALMPIGNRQSAYDAVDGSVYVASQCATV